MPSKSLISHQEADYSQLHQLALDKRWLFVGIDLAPNNQLESGITVLDRDRTLLRMDKLYSDDAILQYLQQLGPPDSLIITVDLPKNLTLSSRFLQEEVKLHPFRITKKGWQRPDTSRFGARGALLYQQLKQAGFLPLLIATYEAKLHFGLLTPYRSRSPHGCRALQLAIRQHLGLRNLPANLAPSSVLESMVGAYSAWLFWVAQPGEHYQLYYTRQQQLLIKPRQCFAWDNESLRPDWIPH